MAWVNPRYRDITGHEPPSSATATADERVAPQDRGERLATLPRHPREGPDAELRVSIASYEGHKFLSLRVWIHNAATGAWYPDKAKGCSVRLREAEIVADAIMRGLAMAGGAPQGTRGDVRDQGRGGDQSRGRGADDRRDGPGLPDPGASREPFDEFAEDHN